MEGVKRWQYRYSDLILSSTICFPELAEVDGEKECNVRIGLSQESTPEVAGRPAERIWTLPDGTPWTTFHRVDNDWFVNFPEFCGFRLAGDGTGVECYPQADTEIETVRHLILNQVLPLVMCALGRHAFHASAVEWDGRAAVFSGPSGAGKSTLALEFARNGGRFLSDDLVVFEYSEKGMEVLPSYPALRVCRDTLDQAGRNGLRVAPSAEYSTKARILAGKGVEFQERRVPLGAIYLIGGESDRVEIREVTGAEAVVELVRASFVLDAGQRQYLASHFERVSDLSTSAKVFRLEYKRNYDHLAAARKSISEHLRSLELSGSKNAKNS